MKSSKPPFSPLCIPFIKKLSPEHRDHPSDLKLFDQSDVLHAQEGAVREKSTSVRKKKK